MKRRQIRSGRSIIQGFFAVLLLVISLGLIGLQSALASESYRELARPTAQQADPNRCYAVADGTDVAQNSSAPDTLAFLDRVTGDTAAVGGGVGNTGTFGIEAIAFRPGGVILYAADEEQLGTLNLNTGNFTPLPEPFGDATGFVNGALITTTLIDVDGLSWDVTTNILYGADRRLDGGDLLFQINPTTGRVVQDAFTVNGVAVDFVQIGTVIDPTDGVLDDVDDIAVSPVTGTMYASINKGGSTTNYLVTIDKETGAILSATIITDGAINVQDIEGLAFFNDGELYGSSGKDAPAQRETLYQIDRTTAVATVRGSFTDPLRDFEGLDCLTASAAIVIEKATNGEDADSAPGPTLQIGSTVTWTYFVRNTGGLTLTNVLLTDDNGTAGDPSDDFPVICRDVGGNPVTPLTLASGQSNLDLGLTCEATGIAIRGQYGNVATVTGFADVTGEEVTDSDPSHYVGAGAAIAVLKSNDANGDGQFSDSEEAPSGNATVTFQLVITNTGTLQLTIDSIVDDIHGADGALTTTSAFTPACADLLGTTLAPDASATCYFDGTLALGDNASEVNTVTVTADSDLGAVSDQDTSTVTIVPVLTPLVEVLKTLELSGDAADGIVTVGQNFTYTIEVRNSGNVTLTVVPLTDTYDATYLSFLRATPAPDSTAPGSLIWNDLTGAGVLPPQGTISVQVTFNALASTDLLPNKQTLNRARVEGATDGNSVAPPVEDDAPIRITDPTVAVAKTVTDPANGEVALNGLVTFTISITNTGDTVLDIIPVRDIYDPDDLAYVRSSLNITPLLGVGELSWSDVTPELGDPAPGEAISFQITFRFINPNVESTVNVVRLGNVLDENGDFAGTPQGEAASSVTTPTPILLISFTATAVENGIALDWVTGAEIDAFGFHLWRSADPQFENAVRVTKTLIVAKGAGGAGATYHHVDTGIAANTNYHYWLQEIATNGDTLRFGPITVRSSSGDNPSAGGTIYLPSLSR
jgi:uncharacterized repeat protein (TIGR01451 family)